MIQIPFKTARAATAGEKAAPVLLTGVGSFTGFPVVLHLPDDVATFTVLLTAAKVAIAAAAVTVAADAGAAGATKTEVAAAAVLVAALTTVGVERAVVF